MAGNHNHTIKRAWRNGPLRNFYITREASNQIPHDSGLYAGTYVCEQCRKDVSGIYGPLGGRWVCSRCKGSQMSTFKVDAVLSEETA